MAYQHVREDPRPLSSINPRVPPELDAIVLKAMSKNPANRYQSAAEMRSDLLRALAGQRVEATPVMGDAEKTAIIGGPVTRLRLRRRRRGRLGDEDERGPQAQAPDHHRRRDPRPPADRRRHRGARALGNEEEPGAGRQQVAVPQLVGQQQAAAEAALDPGRPALGEVTPRITEHDAEVGTVLESTSARRQVDEGPAVDLVVGAAPDTLAIPNVVGLNEDRARSTLEQAGFTSINRRLDSLEDEGTVVSIDFAEGQQATPRRRSRWRSPPARSTCPTSPARRRTRPRRPRRPGPDQRRHRGGRVRQP